MLNVLIVCVDRSSGTSRDWAAGVAHIPFVYTVELRDRGRHGFLLPPDQILETGVETWEGVKAMMRAVRKLDSVRRSSSANAADPLDHDILR